MAYLLRSDDPVETSAALRLAREFPSVPWRIITEIVHAYHLRSSNRAQITSAARDRLRDACATD